jgi:hypothetical protein
VQRQGALKQYQYLDGHALLLVDGTGHFASSKISCPECCVKESQGKAGYYHQLLGAVLAHPQLKTVLPMAAEAITRQDGVSKNDCEVRFVDPKPYLNKVRGMGPESEIGNWL